MQAKQAIVLLIKRLKRINTVSGVIKEHAINCAKKVCVCAEKNRLEKELRVVTTVKNTKKAVAGRCKIPCKCVVLQS